MNNKILVIEDDPIALRLVHYTLQHEGYQVLTAPNGLEGLKKAREEELPLSSWTSCCQASMVLRFAIACGLTRRLLTYLF